jgi:hypothetical protein
MTPATQHLLQQRQSQKVMFGIRHVRSNRSLPVDTDEALPISLSDNVITMPEPKNSLGNYLKSCDPSRSWSLC